MIQPPSLLEALQRAGLGLGDAATGMQQVDQGNQQIAASKTNQAVQNQTLLGEMKKRQLLDAMAALDKNQPTAASSLPMGAGKAGLGMDASGMPTGLQGPGAAKAGVGAPPGGMDDARASLMANWYRENGKPELGTPDAVKAFSAQKMTEMKNAATLSSQDVARGQIANDTGAFDLGQKKTLAPFQQTTEQNKAAASAFEPAQAKATLGQTQAETNRANAEANKAKVESENGGLLPKDKMRLENNFRVQWDGENKAYESQAQGFMNMMGAGEKKTGASDQALLDSFVQTITGSKRPTHSQYEIAMKSYGLDDLFNKWSAGAKGQWLTDTQRQNLKDVAIDEMKNIHSRHLALKNEKSKELINSHGDPANAFPSAQYEDQVGKYLADGTTSSGLSDDEIIKQVLGKK